MARRIQHYITDDGTVFRFRDRRENTHSAKCQPRDIELIDSVDRALETSLREAITIDIRRHQGYPEVGIAKGMLWK